MGNMAVLENVRRYRTIASLCRQTAAFRPAQKWTLLEQAFEWERLAMTELDACFTIPRRDGRSLPLLDRCQEGQTLSAAGAWSFGV
jgi:hypothetical protein